MTKKKVSKLFSSNIFWAAVSLLAALCIWVYMTGTQEESITKDLKGVEVVFAGEDTLQSQRGLVVTDASVQTVDVTISGTRMNIGRLTSDDVKAVIDVSRITNTSNYTSQYTLTFPDGVPADEISLVSGSPTYISYQITRMDDKVIPVEVKFSGSVAEDHMLGDLEYEPQTITVRGPQSVLETIDHAYTEITLTDLDTTRTVETGFELMDADGNILDKEGLEFDFDTISVTIPISVVKTVPIYVTLIEGAGATRSNTRIQLDYDEITIAGDAAELESINRIEIGPIDLTSFDLTYEDDLDIALPNNVENVSGIETVHVSLEVTGLVLREFTVTNLSYDGLPDGYSAELVTHSLTVRIRATQQAMESLNSTNIRAVADLSDTSATGTMDTSKVRVIVDGALNAGAVGTYRLTFNISR